jgi:hypothetical protein
MENKLTVFCAVWHKDKNREALLRGHMKTLDQLQSQVDRIYVFDGNDSPPKWLKGEIIKVKEWFKRICPVDRYPDLPIPDIQKENYNEPLLN